MSCRDDKTTLQAILDHIIEAITQVGPQKRDDLDTKRVVYLAMLQLCQVVGEAATRLSQELCETEPDVPSSEIIAFRNRLIHGYHVIDRDILWEIHTPDFPKLRGELKDLLTTDHPTCPPLKPISSPK